MDDQKTNQDTVGSDTPETSSPEMDSSNSNLGVEASHQPVTEVSAMEEEGISEASKKKNKSGVIALVIVVAMIAVAAAAFWYQKTHSQTAELGGVSYPPVVAVVNGQNVSAAEFKQSYQQAEGIAGQQGFDPSDETVKGQIKDQALTVLINTVLIVQAAKEAGYTVTDADIDAEIAKLETQFGGSEQLASVLESAGLTKTSVRDDLADQLVVDKYLASSPEWQGISVTEEEKHTLYDQVAGQSEGVPPYEEVATQVEDQLRNDKQQAATETIIARLRESATIETKI